MEGSRDRELDGIFEPGEYGYRDGLMPRTWHNECCSRRELRLRNHAGGQFVFNVCAGTGAGKTDLAGLIASSDLNLGRIRRVVVCVPTKVVQASTAETFRDKFDIHLALFDSRKHRNGVTSDNQGYVVTYGNLARQASRHARITGYEPTLVVFDEVHHLGDNASWGLAAQFAFARAPYVLAMSGSPIRPAGGGQIVWANYIPSKNLPGVLEYEADYVYTLGRAILDGYCREPDFRFSDDAVVEISYTDGRKAELVGFKEDVHADLASLRLNAAVNHKSAARKPFLSRALSEIRKAGRKAIIFLGSDAGDGTTPTEDATKHLPGQLVDLGYSPDEFMVITKDTPRSHDRIRQFRQSKTAWILITINMVSEGANVPELSAAIFLTNWTSDLSFIQRIGRALRFMGTGDHKDAWIYLFHHPSYRDVALRIKEQINAAVFERKRREREGVEPREFPCRPEARAISGGEITYTIWNGQKYPAPLYYDAVRIIESRNISKAYLTDVIESLAKEQCDGDGGQDRRHA